MADRLYLDHAATTPLCAEAREAMLPWLGSRPANPSSLHAEGRRARAAIDEARETLSQAFGSLFAEALFTGSGTEAANLALLGLALEHQGGPRRRILLGAAEHHCVLETAPILRTLGYQVDLIPVDREGRVLPEALRACLSEDVLLVSVMHANNELGTLNPLDELIPLARRHRAWFHSDCTQTFLRLPLPPADLVTVSAHKVYGPQGVGAIRLANGVQIKPLAVGGGQERELRAGTENVAAIAGFAAAIRAWKPTDDAASRQAFLAEVPGPVLTVDLERTPCLPGHLHLRFPGLSAESLLIVLDRLGVSASSGAACSSGSLQPSHVLLACGYTKSEAQEGLRFTFGKLSPPEVAAEAGRRLAQAVTQVATARA